MRWIIAVLQCSPPGHTPYTIETAVLHLISYGPLCLVKSRKQHDDMNLRAKSPKLRESDKASINCNIISKTYHANGKSQEPKKTFMQSKYQ